VAVDDLPLSSLSPPRVGYPDCHGLRELAVDDGLTTLVPDREANVPVRPGNDALVAKVATLKTGADPLDDRLDLRPALLAWAPSPEQGGVVGARPQAQTHAGIAAGHGTASCLQKPGPNHGELIIS